MTLIREKQGGPIYRVKGLADDALAFAVARWLERRASCTIGGGPFWDLTFFVSQSSGTSEMGEFEI